MKFRKVLLISGLMLPFNFIYAANDAKAPVELQKPSVFESVSYVPRVYLSGYGGTTFMGQADVLAPIHFTNSNIFFAYLQARMSNTHDSEDSWGDETPSSASLGFGYRAIVKDKALLGIYGFGDYAHTSTGHDVYVLSPGVEELGRVWDARINAYFPVGDKSWESGNWADQYNDYHWNYFTGHNQYDHWYVFKEETGNGFDAEVGRKLFKYKGVLVKGYVGGYYYNMQDNDDITGGSLKLSAQPNKFLTIIAQDTYDDTYHNVFTVGVKIKLNDLVKMNKEDISVDEDDLPQRLVDSIDRNLIANGNGSVVPTNFGGPYDKGQGLEHDNVWFFDDDKTNPGDGTYENPYNAAQYTQNTIEIIHQSKPTDPAYIYLSDGGYTSTDTIDLYSGQSMWGRTDDYKAPATGDGRPVINGQLELNGNNTIDSLIIQNIPGVTGVTDGYGMFGTAIFINGSNVTLSNDLIGANDNAIGYATGVVIGDCDLNINIINSDIYAYSSGSISTNTYDEFNAIGVEMGANSSLTVDNSRIYASTDVLVAPGEEINVGNTGNAIGILAAGVYDNITVKNHSDIEAASYIVDPTEVVAGFGEYYTFVGNTYGILMEPLYSSAKGQAPAVEDLSVHDNSLNIDSSSVNAQSTLNFTGLEDVNIYNSGNSNGVFIGLDNVLEKAVPVPVDRTDPAIYNNIVNVSNGSEVTANSNISLDKSDGNIDSSGYSDGIFIGANSSGDGGKRNESLINAVAGFGGVSVYNNEINVSNSKVAAGSLLTVQEFSYYINVNNSAYVNAIGIGNNTIMSGDGAAPDFSAADSAIFDNSIKVSNTTLDANSTINTSSNSEFNKLYINDSGYSNDILIGTNYAYYVDGDMSIHDNSIEVSNSTLNAKSEATISDSVDTADSSTGKIGTSNYVENSLFSNAILVGYNYANSNSNYSANFPLAAPDPDLSVHDNDINVKSSELNAAGSLDIEALSNVDQYNDIFNTDNSNAILIGINSFMPYGLGAGSSVSAPDSDSIPSDFSVYNNNVTVSSSTLDSTASLTMKNANSNTNTVSLSASSADILIGHNFYDEFVNSSEPPQYNADIYNNNVSVLDNSKLASSASLDISSNIDSANSIVDATSHAVNGSAISNGILIGNNLFASDFSSANIHDNQVTINGSAITAQSYLSYSLPDVVAPIYHSDISNAIMIGNGYFTDGVSAAERRAAGKGGIYGSISNNAVDIWCSNLSADAILNVNTVESYVQESGNANGLIIGNNYSDTDYAVTFINDNEAQIKNSSIKAENDATLVTSDISVADYSALSNAVLIGNNYLYISDGNASIYSNTVNIQNSDLDADSSISITGYGIETAASGNANTLMIGNNFLSASESSADIYNNDVDIWFSNLHADASYNGTADYYATVYLAGNANSVLIGNNAAQYEYVNDSEISYNQIDILHSNLEANSALTFSIPGGDIQSSGNASDIMIGDGFLESSYGYSSYAGIYNNYISVADSKLTGTSNISGDFGSSFIETSGNSYGINIGYNEIGQFYGDNGIYGNEIFANDNDFNITANGPSGLSSATSGNSGAAYGISLGNYYGYGNANAIYAACNNFNIGASDNNDSWGIWMMPDGGTLNYDAATINTFNLTQGSGGGKILWPNGTITPW